jgi:hypothetical protein
MTPEAAASASAQRRFWSEPELALLRARYACELTADIARALGRCPTSVYGKAAKLGLRKSAAFVAECSRRAMSDPAHPGRQWHFGADGVAPWNKGLKGMTGTHPNSTVNHFKPGQLSGRAAQLVLPLGTLRVSSDGVLERKVCETSGPSNLRWKAVHRLLWEQAHGAVPAGHVVVFRVGRKTTDDALITLDALELVSRAENMRRNSVHAKYPPELARLVQVRGALTAQINRKAKEGRNA